MLKLNNVSYNSKKRIYIMNIKDSIVLITGADRGIGKGFADELFKAGAKKIYLGACKPETVINYAAHHPGKMVPIRLDVTNPTHIKEASKKAHDVNVLINNAGVLHTNSLFDKEGLKKAQHEMAVNFFAPLAMIRAFTPVIEKNGGGVIINIPSVAGLVATPDITTYSASKAALHFLTLATRIELAEKNVHVMGLYPSPADTEMVHANDKNREIACTSHIARETIRAMQAREYNVFPDPHLKSIYAVLHSEHHHQTHENTNEPKRKRIAKTG